MQEWETYEQEWEIVAASSASCGEEADLESDVEERVINHVGEPSTRHLHTK